MSTVIQLAIVLGIMVLVHELGHFIVAKLCRVRVEVFSIGFGTRLFGFKRGDTDYRLSLLPLGGYVKMSGEMPGETKSDDPGELENHPRWQRVLIALAGPFFNFLLAIALMTGVYMVHNEVQAYLNGPAHVDYVSLNTPAAHTGIQGGDTIAAFIMEPVLGAGGVIVPPESFMKLAREICDRHGILMISDEVVTGFGRTGAWSGARLWGVKPDMMTIAKAITRNVQVQRASRCWRLFATYADAVYASTARSSSPSSRTTLPGTPATSTPAGIFLPGPTSAPAATSVPAPMRAPPRTIAPMPMSEPVSTYAPCTMAL